MKALLSTLITLTLATPTLWATAQIPDILVYKGKEHSLHNNPMEAYFEKHPKKQIRGGVTSTALWRGYVATFEFKEKNLVLKDIQVQNWDDKKDETKWKSMRHKLVAANEDLVIDWYSGLLLLPRGKLVEYVHMGYLSTYSEYSLLEIKKGVLTEERHMTLKEFQAFKKQQFEAFKKTDAYDKAVKEYMDDKVDHDKIDGYLERGILYYTKEFLVEPAKKNVAPENKK